MQRCECGHDLGDHVETSICQKVIHYPSEDYPCLCTGYVATENGDCAECEHPVGLHVTVTRCKPPGGELCVCTRLRPHEV